MLKSNNYWLAHYFKRFHFTLILNFFRYLKYLFYFVISNFAA